MRYNTCGFNITCTKVRQEILIMLKMLDKFIIITIITGIMFRLLLILLFEGNYDSQSYRIVADIVSRGGNVYAETPRYNYSPVWMYILYFLNVISQGLHIPLWVLVRSSLMTAEFVDYVLVIKIADELGIRQFRLLTAQIYLNPGMIFLTGLHGQFEVLALIPILLMIWLWLRGSVRLWVTMALSMVAVIVKQNVVFVLWPLLVYFLSIRQSIIIMLTSTIGFLATLLVYIAVKGGTSGIIDNVILYTSVPSFFGISWIFPETSRLPLMLLSVTITPLLLLSVNRTINLAYYMTVSILVWYTTTCGFGWQYIIFLLIFGALLMKTWLIPLLVGVLVAVGEFGLVIDTEYPLHISKFIAGLACISYLVFLLLNRRLFSGIPSESRT